MNYVLVMAFAAGFIAGILFILWVWKVPPGFDD